MKERSDHPHPVERCEATTMGLRCVLPAGHTGEDHQSQILLPPDVGKMIEHHVTRLEAEQKSLVRARRWLFVATAVNVFALLWNVLAILT